MVEAMEKAFGARLAAHEREALLRHVTSAITLFEKLDVNGDGFVSPDEFLKLLPMLKQTHPRERAVPGPRIREHYDEDDLLELFQALDVDGTGELEYSELERLLVGPQ